MAKTLSFTDTSPQTVKIGDTTTSFTLICGNDNVATDLTKATSITVKLGNASGYLKSATVDPASLTDPTTGQVTITFSADLMTSLPAGSYAIEVWVIDPTGTSIYPSDGTTGFTITNNIQSTNGATITTITFEDFVKAMNKAASTIKGEKGDTGSVDNAGLTTAPAFVALQTQVNNSAVGTNLLTGTSSELKLGNVPAGKKDSGQEATNGFQYAVNAGETYTYQVYLGKENPVDSHVIIGSYDESKNWYDIIGQGNTVLANTGGVSEVTFTVPNEVRYINLTPLGFSAQSTDITVYWKEEKLEKGSVATDWCPNPTEILTQADYAKIKAAIVALGGSLS
ncbi:collagen-like protein [Lactiplantibacillus plantarum]|uniref:collagen-like protein n=1 Tax=Lactiplantibacillus plantarum TaxID=1590 RepID=UPI003C26AA07